MPRRARVAKRRDDDLTLHEFFNLTIGAHGDRPQYLRWGNDPAGRADAYAEHRDRLLARFWKGGRPPDAAVDYDDDPDFVRAAVEWWITSRAFDHEHGGPLIEIHPDELRTAAKAHDGTLVELFDQLGLSWVRTGWGRPRHTSPRRPYADGVT